MVMLLQTKSPSERNWENQTMAGSCAGRHLKDTHKVASFEVQTQRGKKENEAFANKDTNKFNT